MSNPPTQPNPTPTPSAGDPVADRRAKLAKLRNELQVDPYGRRVDGLISLSVARAKYDKAADDHVKSPKPIGVGMGFISRVNDRT